MTDVPARLSDVELERLVDALTPQERHQLRRAMYLDDVREREQAVIEKIRKTVRTTTTETTTEIVRTPVAALPPAPTFRDMPDWGGPTPVPPAPWALQAAPARRPPTVREIAVGVHCCDPQVTHWWRRFREHVGIGALFTVFAMGLLFATVMPSVAQALLVIAGTLFCIACVLVIAAKRGPWICL